MSPISEEELARHRHILLYDDEPVMNAVISLRDAGGMDWWYLVVDLEEGGYAAARFSDLAAYLDEHGADVLEQPLGDLVGTLLKRVEVIADLEESDSDSVRDQVFKSDSQVAVMKRQAEFKGILPAGVTRSGGLFESELIRLAGQYATIPEKGTLSRRRKQAKKKKDSASTQNPQGGDR